MAPSVGGDRGEEATGALTQVKRFTELGITFPALIKRPSFGFKSPRCKAYPEQERAYGEKILKILRSNPSTHLQITRLPPHVSSDPARLSDPAGPACGGPGPRKLLHHGGATPIR